MCKTYDLDSLFVFISFISVFQVSGLIDSRNVHIYLQKFAFMN